MAAYDASERVEKFDPFRWKGPNFNVGQAGAVDMLNCCMAACTKGAIMAANGVPPIADDADTDVDGAGTMDKV